VDESVGDAVDELELVAEVVEDEPDATVELDTTEFVVRTRAACQARPSGVTPVNAVLK